MGAGMVSAGTFAAGNSTTEQESGIIKEYRKFGRTGFQVSDFSSGNPTNEAVLRALLKSGVNLIDTGEVYMNGNSERMIGNVIQDFDRSKLFINTKLYTEKEFPSKEEVIKRTNECLERLKTDYIDCIKNQYAQKHFSKNILFEKNISEDEIVGRAVFRVVPYLGWAKLVFFEASRPGSEKGFCHEN